MLRGLSSGTLRKSLHALDDLRPLAVELQEVLVKGLLLALWSDEGKQRSANESSDESTSERPTSHQGVMRLTSSRFWHLWSSRRRWLLQ